MSVQPAASLPRRPVSFRPAGRRARLDPPNTFQAPHHVFLREPARPAWIETENPELAPLPVAPLAATPGAPRAPRKWVALLFASVALHAAIAGFFLLRGDDEGVRIAGAQDAGVAMYGNSAADMTAEGEEETTNVSIIIMTPAKPVETIDASAVEHVEAVQPVAETTPVQQAATAPPADPAPTERVAAAETPRTEATTSETTTAEPTPMQQQVLAVDTAEIVPDAEAVAPVLPRAAEVPPPDEVVEVPQEVAVAETPEEVAEVEPEPERVEPPPPPKVVEARPEPRPVEKPKPVKKAEARPAEKKPAKADAPARKAEKKSTAGAGGKSKADARKGVADGEANGTRADNAGKGKGSSAGNAAVSNYPGKVVSKLKRAVRGISSSARRGADRDVHVSFTVTASGALGGVSVTRSSGSATLDSAALQAVRRAAPFPPIPDGRKSWSFSFPLGLK